MDTVSGAVSALGALGAILIVLMLLSLWVLALLGPFFMFSIARNFKKIRLELERLNLTLESRSAQTGGPIGL